MNAFKDLLTLVQEMNGGLAMYGVALCKTDISAWIVLTSNRMNCVGNPSIGSTWNRG
jgi:hypothetical protein